MGDPQDLGAEVFPRAEKLPLAAPLQVRGQQDAHLPVDEAEDDRMIVVPAIPDGFPRGARMEGLNPVAAPAYLHAAPEPMERHRAGRRRPKDPAAKRVGRAQAAFPELPHRHCPRTASNPPAWSRSGWVNRA